MDIETILILLAIWACIIPLLLADAITYGLARIITRRAGDNDTVDYFVAGMCCQPLQAFAFMFDLPALKGDTLKLLPYSQRRAHFQKMTEAILDDIAKNHYRKVRIFAISVGATVPYMVGQKVAAGEVEDDFELECHLISPCYTKQFIKIAVGLKIQASYPLMIALRLALGPLSFVPIVPGCVKLFSVSLVVSQVEQFLFASPIDYTHREYVKSVILSNDDEYLHNLTIAAFYKQQKPVWLDGVKHADTIRAFDKYRAAMKEILTIPRS